jgi:amino acid transporter
MKLIQMIMVPLLLKLFRDWGTLAAVISTATLVAYLTGPTTVIALRKMGPTMK